MTHDENHERKIAEHMDVLIHNLPPEGAALHLMARLLDGAMGHEERLHHQLPVKQAGGQRLASLLHVAEGELLGAMQIIDQSKDGEVLELGPVYEAMRIAQRILSAVGYGCIRAFQEGGPKARRTEAMAAVVATLTMHMEARILMQAIQPGQEEPVPPGTNIAERFMQLMGAIKAQQAELLAQATRAATN